MQIKIAKDVWVEWQETGYRTHTAEFFDKEREYGILFNSGNTEGCQMKEININASIDSTKQDVSASILGAALLPSNAQVVEVSRSVEYTSGIAFYTIYYR